MYWRYINKNIYLLRSCNDIIARCIVHLDELLAEIYIISCIHNLNFCWVFMASSLCFNFSRVWFKIISLIYFYVMKVTKFKLTYINLRNQKDIFFNDFRRHQWLISIDKKNFVDSYILKYVQEVCYKGTKYCFS